MEEDSTDSGLKRLNWLIGLALLLFVVACYSYFSTFGLNTDAGVDANGIIIPTTENARRDLWGTFGDFMGGTLNPIFAFFSLVAIIYTIRIQTSELKLSRIAIQAQNEAQQLQLAQSKALSEAQIEESKTQSEAQLAQSKSFKLQNESIKLQTFENTFFKLLEHHNTLNKEFYSYIEHRGIPMQQIINPKENIVELFIIQNEGIIKKYFMSLYQILKFVIEQEVYFIDSQSFDSKRYTNIIRATFNDRILVILSINCSILGFEKYKELVEHYSMFEHLDISFIRTHGSNTDYHPVQPEIYTPRILDILRAFDKKAFGDNNGLKSLIDNPPPVGAIRTDHI